MNFRSYYLLILLLTLTLVGCGNEEEASENNVTPATKETEPANNDNDGDEITEEENTEESTEASVDKEGFQLIETVKVFGGGTFDLNKEHSSPEDIYVVEFDKGIYTTFNDDDGTIGVSGSTDGWKSITNAENGFDRIQREPQYARGNMLYEMKDDVLTVGKFNFDDMNEITHTGKQISEEDGELYFVNTSEGEGVILSEEEKNTLFIDGEPILEFENVKDVFEMASTQKQNPYESTVYVDTVKKKLFFVSDDDGSIHVIDLVTGEPLFEDGELKGIQMTDDVDIIGDDNGNIYVFLVDGDQISLGVYNSNLDFISEFPIPVENPHDFAVTKTKDEFHIWSRHEYELEQAIELVKISRPTFNE